MSTGAVRAPRSTGAYAAGGPRSRSSGRAGWLLLVLAAAGLLVVAVAFAGARTGATWADPLFWTGLLVIVVPIGFRLLGPDAGRGERLGLVVVLGLTLYAVKVLHSPLWFTNHDELGQYRTTDDILVTGHLLSVNPVVGAYAKYPGLESATAALARLTGLGIFPSGLVVVGLARLVLSVALFAFVERVARSARVAGIAALVYTANPNFLFFDAQYAYESLGIALAAATLWTTVAARGEEDDRRGPALGALILAAGTIVTHHVTSYALAVTLVIWALTDLVRRRRARRPVAWALPLVALGTVVGVVAWAFVAGSSTQGELGPVVRGAFSAVFDVLRGTGQSKQPFSTPPGFADPPLERVVGLTSVGLLLVTLPFGLLAVVRERRRHAALLVLGLAALAYPATLALRLTTAGTETSNRASEFVFVGLGAALGLAVLRWLAPRWQRRRGVRPMAGRGLLAAVAGLLFVGGLIVGWAPYARLPGRYEPAAAARSVEAEGVLDARWAGTFLPRRAVILSDATNDLLYAAYGGLDPQGGQIFGRSAFEVFLAPRFGKGERAILSALKVRYLVVDRRLSLALPRTGRYFGTSDPRAGQYQEPLEPQLLAKFDHVPALDRVFSSGDVIVYDARRVLAR